MFETLIHGLFIAYLIIAAGVFIGSAVVIAGMGDSLAEATPTLAVFALMWPVTFLIALMYW